MSDMDREIINEFVVESKEGLDSIEDDFLTLEKTKDNLDDELVNKVFRAIHSIKGSAGFLGLENLAHLAHVMENLIDKIRDRYIQPESRYVDALLQGVDLLNVMLDDIDSSNEIDATVVVDTLNKLLEQINSNEQTSEDEDLSEDAVWNIPETKPTEIQETEIPKDEDLSEDAIWNLPESNSQENENNPEPAVEPKSTPDKNISANKDKPKGTDTIRIGVELLDKLMRMAGELVLIRNQQLLHVDKSDAASRSISQKLDAVTTDIQEGIMKTRMQPIGNVFGKFPRVIRDMGKKLGKKLEISTTGNDVELDKTILESLADPLTHLIRNSCDHGIELPEERVKAGKSEESTIFLHAYHEGGQINIKIVDDGKGINTDAVKNKVLEKGLKTSEELDAMTDSDLANLITLPGLSTAKEVTDVSGRGVGMDVVCTSIEKLGGSLEITTQQGKGTTVLLKLPLTLAIIPSLLIRVGEERFAIPQVSLEELVCLYDEDVHHKLEIAGLQEVFRLRDRLLPIVRLQEILKQDDPFTEEVKTTLIKEHQQNREQNEDQKSLVFAVLKLGNDRFGLIVDEVLGTEEIVVKPMHPALKGLHCYSGATVLGDGKVALILDVEGISKFAGISYHGIRDDSDKHHIDEGESLSVLLFKSGAEEQFAVPLTDIKRVEHVSANRFEKAGPHTFINVDETPTRVIKLDDHIPVSDCHESDEMYLLLPKGDHPFGLLISSLVNIEDVSGKLNEESYSQEGLLGSSLIDDSMTLFVDINKIGEMALKGSA